VQNNVKSNVCYVHLRSSTFGKHELATIGCSWVGTAAENYLQQITQYKMLAPYRLLRVDDPTL